MPAIMLLSTPASLSNPTVANPPKGQPANPVPTATSTIQNRTQIRNPNMWSRFRALMSSDEPGWGRGGGGSEEPRPPDRPPQRPPQRPQDGPPDLDELWRDLSRRLNGIFNK